MVKKLFKWELIDSFKRFRTVFILIGIATLIGILLMFQFSAVANQSGYAGLGSLLSVGLMLLILMGLACVIIIMTFLANVYILYQNLYEKNAYRMFTLPAESWELLVSKLGSVLLWTFVAILVGTLGLVIVSLVGSALSPDFAETMGDALREMNAILNFFNFDFTRLSSILVSLLEMIVNVLIFGTTVLLAGAISNSSSVTKSRNGWTFGFFFGLVMLRTWIRNIFAIMFFSNFSYYYGYHLGWHITLLIINIIFIAVMCFATLRLWDKKLEVI